MKLPTLQLPFLHNLTTGWRFLVRNHYFVVIILLLISISGAVYIVGQTLQLPADDQYRDQKASISITAKFDQATIDKIKQLQRSNEQPASFAPPAGTRSNPFAE